MMFMKLGDSVFFYRNLLSNSKLNLKQDYMYVVNMNPLVEKLEILKKRPFMNTLHMYSHNMLKSLFTRIIII